MARVLTALFSNAPTENRLPILTFLMPTGEAKRTGSVHNVWMMLPWSLA